MSDRKLIGRVSATEKYPSSCDDFQFWLADDAILSPFDIVRVENKTDDSVTYGVVQDILHITDGTGHLSNYVSSDFGNVDTTPMTRRLSLSYAKVSVIHNTKENSRSLSTGKQAKTKNKDYVRDVEFVYAEASDGQPLYIGWLALTDFSGIISDESVQGIRFRKGNILVGNNTTFVKYFPSEGHNANRMFAGEIYALHKDLIPNSQRDDFEPNTIYGELRQALGKWAGEINKKYRRGMSEATSALRRLNQLNAAQKDLEDKIDSGAITSDEKREQIAEQLKQIAKKREIEEKTVRKAQERGTFDAERKETVEKVLAQTETASKKMTSLNKKVVNADYATKHDLPSSYSRDERKLYQRIITVIDTFFTDDPQIAESLREAIKTELSVKKK